MILTSDLYVEYMRATEWQLEMLQLELNRMSSRRCDIERLLRVSLKMLRVCRHDIPWLVYCPDLPKTARILERAGWYNADCEIALREWCRRENLTNWKADALVTFSLVDKT